ncbi:MAG: VCBS repeat-containing protein [Planctomycetes bacterium]|nr:VCBS repeat-containing protein [Planctomycetota bacterium]
MQSARPHLSLTLPGLLALTAPLHAQIFSNSPTKLPSDTGRTENVDFADVDGDGDLDAALAEGGEYGDDQNNLWINRGFEAGGTLGFLADRTATQFPALLDASGDIEFADIDGDGDVDIYVANQSMFVNQSSRWWINMGGVQGGTQGFFQDQTPSRWSGLNVAPTSIAASVLLPGGGFIDWSGDGDFGDLDNDGDLDLVHSSYGPVFSGTAPTRVFLNNGDGLFQEFNPSGFRLASASIQNGNPALWAQGAQQADTNDTSGTNADIATNGLDIDLGDIDGDLDLDLLHGARDQAVRMFRNRLVENGGALTALTDISSATFAPGSFAGGSKYEQEMGDCDNDGDLDLYGVSWRQIGATWDDLTLVNNGTGFLAVNQTLPDVFDDNEADFLDYDNDGDLDVYVASFGGQDRLYRNDFTGAGVFSHTNVTATQLPVFVRIALDADCADLDHDGDTEVVVGNHSGQLDVYLTNESNVADTHAPRVPNVEQAPNRATGIAPTVVRAQVYDNASYYETWYIDVQLEFRVAPSGFLAVPMHASQGQIWRGEIPGQVAGLVEYRVRATDRNGNVGVSTTRSFNASGSGGVVYCTAGTTTNGCTPSITGSGLALASATSGFTLTVANVEGQRAGLIYYGLSGRAALPWGSGGTSLICVKVPTQRMTASTSSGGTFGACDGVLSEDWRAFLATHPSASGNPLQAGVQVNAQGWFRDPPAVKSTNLSNALEFVVLP